jgi:AraC-like DNA-binding protein
MQSGALLTELFCYYLDLPAGEEDSLGHRALSRFQNLLHKHACDDRSLEDLATEAGISADHLRHLFGRRFGMRPLEYRNGLRLSKARDLLVSTDMNVKEAALRSGFTDPLYFSRVFRRRFGITPRDMIRRYRMI